ncbi:MAG: hypothetical protein IKX65_07880 [Prevotella sp.]|nr:hypothetical protein [Prevotella sp.]
MKKKTIYCAPFTEVLQLATENLLEPESWNPDYGHGGNIGIIEGDPEEGDGHGAKANNPYAFVDIDWDDEDIWESDIKSLWD